MNTAHTCEDCARGCGGSVAGCLCDCHPCNDHAHEFVVFLHENGTLRSARNAYSYDESAENYQAIANTAHNRARVRELLSAMEKDAGETPASATASFLSALGFYTLDDFQNPDNSETHTAENTAQDFISVTYIDHTDREDIISDEQARSEGEAEANKRED